MNIRTLFLIKPALINNRTVSAIRLDDDNAVKSMTLNTESQYVAIIDKYNTNSIIPFANIAQAVCHNSIEEPLNNKEVLVKELIKIKAKVIK